MAGLNVGGFGGFPGQPRNTPIANPRQNIPSPGRSQGNFRNMQGRGRGRGRGMEQGMGEGIDTSPSKPRPFRGPMGGGGINIGRGNAGGALPTPSDPYRTYGSVSGGRMTRPQNPYGRNQSINFTPGGEFGGRGPGPIDIGPSPYGQTQKPPTNPLMNPIPGPIATPPPMQAPGPRDYNMGRPQIPPLTGEIGINTGPTPPGGYGGYDPTRFRGQGIMPSNIPGSSEYIPGYQPPPIQYEYDPNFDPTQGRGGFTNYGNDMPRPYPLPVDWGGRQPIPDMNQPPQPYGGGGLGSGGGFRRMWKNRPDEGF